MTTEQQPTFEVSEKKRGASARHRLLVVGVSMLGACYLVAILADFIAPYAYASQSRREPFAPRAAIRRCPAELNSGIFPGLCLTKQILVDPLERRYADRDDARPQPLSFSHAAIPTSCLGLLPLTVICLASRLLVRMSSRAFIYWAPISLGATAFRD
ncbi:MAG: hypothetical protein WKF84_30425 [Pyrinomonadaceae bacterium]